MIECGRIPSGEPFAPTDEASRRSLVHGIERPPAAREEKSDDLVHLDGESISQRHDRSPWRATHRDRPHLSERRVGGFHLPHPAHDRISIYPEDIIKAQFDASKTLSILLSAILPVSLIVGGIGIMSVMLVSVAERTREIGVRVAVGATEEAIQLQFLGESIMLSPI